MVISDHAVRKLYIAEFPPTKHATKTTFFRLTVAVKFLPTELRLQVELRSSALTKPSLWPLVWSGLSKRHSNEYNYHRWKVGAHIIYEQ